jgi:hypothetical protein
VWQKAPSAVISLSAVALMASEIQNEMCNEMIEIVK